MRWPRNKRTRSAWRFLVKGDCRRGRGRAKHACITIDGCAKACAQKNVEMAGGRVAKAIQVAEAFKNLPRREAGQRNFLDGRRLANHPTHRRRRRMRGGTRSRGRGGDSMSAEITKVGIISCSGEAIPEGTISRLATRRVLELLRPDVTVTLCLPLFLSGNEGERNFARTHPTITVDGCPKQCAKWGTEKHSGPVSGALVVSEILGTAGASVPSLLSRGFRDRQRSCLGRCRTHCRRGGCGSGGSRSARCGSRSQQGAVRLLQPDSWRQAHHPGNESDHTRSEPDL